MTMQDRCDIDLDQDRLGAYLSHVWPEAANS